MFYILPFNNDMHIDCMRLEDFIEDYLAYDSTVFSVVDSKDLVIEQASVSKIKDLVKRRLVKFPQLVLEKGELYLSDNSLEITNHGLATFKDSKNNQSIKIKKSKKSFRDYNKYFTKYIKKLNIELDEDYAEYTANTITIGGSNSRLKAEITVQGIYDNFGNPTCVGLFVNKKFICYLNKNCWFYGDRIDFVVSQFRRVDKFYELTISSRDTSQFFTVVLTTMFKIVDIKRLDTVEDKIYKSI